MQPRIKLHHVRMAWLRRNAGSFVFLRSFFDLIAWQQNDPRQQRMSECHARGQICSCLLRRTDSLFLHRLSFLLDADRVEY